MRLIHLGVMRTLFQTGKDARWEGMRDGKEWKLCLDGVQSREYDFQYMFFSYKYARIEMQIVLHFGPSIPVPSRSNKKVIWTGPWLDGVNRWPAICAASCTWELDLLSDPLLVPQTC